MAGVIKSGALYLAEHSDLLIVVLACLQIFLIAGIAWVTSRTWASSAELRHFVWSTASVAMLFIIPANVFLTGWSLEVSAATAVTTGSVATPDRTDPMVDVETETAVPFVNPATPVAANELMALDDDVAQIEAPHTAVPERFSTIHASGSSDRETIFNTTDDSYVESRSLGLSIKTMLVAIYCVVACGLFARLIWGVCRLRAQFRRGRELGGDSQTIAGDAARMLGMTRIPATRICINLTMPLTFGCFRARVAVPADFDSWQPSEKLMVLVHEYVHVGRRDAAWNLVSTIVRTVYWFHPASFFVANRIQLEREYATDEHVLETGVKPGTYATALVSVISRIADRGNQPCLSAAVAMSAKIPLELRIRKLMGHHEMVRGRSTMLFRFFVVLLLFSAASIAIRLEKVEAQETRPQDESAQAVDSESEKPEVAKPAVSDEVSQNVPNRSRVRWFDLFQNCKVNEVERTDQTPVFNLSGQVLLPDGQPAVGAIVVFREWTHYRGSAFTSPMTTHERAFYRYEDVFAKTVTDVGGRFSFNEVVVLKPRSLMDLPWGWDLVAAHESGPVGWVHLPETERANWDGTTQKVLLKPIDSISGRLVDRKQGGIGNAMVSLYALEAAKSDRTNQDVDSNALNLYLSQLMPSATTEEDGTFRFTGVTAGVAALVHATHPGWIGDSAAVATSTGLPLGNRFEGRPGRNKTDTLVASPVTLEADPGLIMNGRVISSDGIPIERAHIGLANHPDKVTTAKDGTFQLRIASRVIDGLGEEAELKFSVTADVEAGVLPQNYLASKNRILPTKQVEIVVERGVKVVGKVIAYGDGSPVEDVFLSTPRNPDELAYGCMTDTDGEFQIILPKGESTLYLYADKTDFALPSILDFLRGTEEQRQRWPHISVSLSNNSTTHELPPFELKQKSQIEVEAVLPDGTPAADALVILVDQGGRENTRRDDMLADPTRTNASGRVALVPRSMPGSSAVVEVQHIHGDDAYSGTTPLPASLEDPLKVQLEPACKIQGRVLINDAPVAGARISISRRTEPIEGGRGFRVDTVLLSHHGLIKTNAEGRYEAVLPPGEVYSISISSVPGTDARFPYGRRVSPTSTGMWRVDDFRIFEADGEIAGQVVDIAGQPAAGVRVGINRSISVNPNAWIGHNEQSDRVTAKDGSFRLRCIPPGTFTIVASGPYNGRRSISATAEARTGDSDVTIVLDASPVPPIPRLQPKSVSEIDSQN